MKSKRFIRYGVIILTAAIILLGALSVISGDFPLFHFANSNWIDDFSYTRDEIHPLKFDTSGCPTIPVKFGEKSAELIFDTGCSTGLDVMTPLEDMIDYTILGKSESINRDGSHRGWSYKIRIPEFSVFGNTFLDVETHLSDWQMVASSPFNGLIGLNYFQSKIITLDYENEKIAVTDRDIDLEKLDKKYAVIPLYHTSTPNRDALLFFEGRVNGESRMIYLDTGKNHSFLHKDGAQFVGGKENETASAELLIGNIELKMDHVFTNTLAQESDFPYPLGFELNSDLIKQLKLLVTIDTLHDRVILCRQ